MYLRVPIVKHSGTFLTVMDVELRESSSLAFSWEHIGQTVVNLASHLEQWWSTPPLCPDSLAILKEFSTDPLGGKTEEIVVGSNVLSELLGNWRFFSEQSYQQFWGFLQFGRLDCPIPAVHGKEN